MNAKRSLMWTGFGLFCAWALGLPLAFVLMGFSYSKPTARPGTLGVSLGPSFVAVPNAGAGGGGGGGGGSTADILVDFESGADGDRITTNANTAPHDLTNMISVGANMTLQSCVSNGAANGVASNNHCRISTTFARRGTRSFRAAHTNNEVWIAIRLKTPSQKTAWSYWFRIDQNWNDGQFESFDESHFTTDEGDNCIFNLDTQAGVFRYGAHAQGVGAQFTFTSNFWYNVQGLYDSNTGGMLLRFYSNGVSLGQSSNNLDVAPFRNVLRNFRFGKCDNHSTFNTGFAYFDDFELWTNGSFPNTPVGGF